MKSKARTVWASCVVVGQAWDRAWSWRRLRGPRRIAAQIANTAQEIRRHWPAKGTICREV